MSLQPGSTKDLMFCQKLDVEGIYDDDGNGNTNSADLDIIGKELRDAHVEVFRQAMADLAVELEKALPGLISAAKVPRDFAAVTNNLPELLHWTRPHLFRQRTSLSADTDAVDFIYNILRNDDRGDKKGTTVLEKLQGVKGLYWWNFKASPSTAEEDEN